MRLTKQNNNTKSAHQPARRRLNPIHANQEQSVSIEKPLLQNSNLLNNRKEKVSVSTSIRD